MAMTLPSWLTLDFLEECLQNKEEYNKVNIISFDASPAVPEGNNFGSCLLRVHMKYKEKHDSTTIHSLTLIVKGPLTEGNISEIFSDYLTEKEPLFYNDYLPEVYKLVKNPFTVESFFSPIPSVIVLEDLKNKGYHMADKLKQLDFQHCRLYLTAAATLHASSIAVRSRNLKLVNALGTQVMFSNEMKNVPLFKTQAKRSLECLADYITNKKHAKLVKDYSSIIWDEITEIHKPSEGLNSLNQGDPWTTNMMFKYDDSGTVCDVKLLDFQCLMYMSPIHDLIFFIWSSVQHEVRRDRLEELYHIYLEALNKNMVELNLTETMTYQQLIEGVYKMTPLVLWLVGFIPCILSPSPPDIDALYSEKNLETDENPFRKYYTEHFCQIHLPQFLEQLESSGIFNYLENLQVSE